MKVKRRNGDGTLGGWESVVPGKETDEQKIKRLEAESLATMIALTEKHEENLQLIAANEQLQKMTLVALEGVAEINEKMVELESKVAPSTE